MLNPPRSVLSGRVPLDGWAPAARRTLAAVACLALTSTAACVSQRAEAVARASAASDAAATRVVLVGGPGTVGSEPWATPGTRTAGAGHEPVRVPVRAPVNVTCPVWVGHPADPSVTEVWQGAVVAFKDADARRAWAADPAAYASRLPRLSGSGGDPRTSRAGVAPVPGAVGTAPTTRAHDGLRTAASKPPTHAALGSPDVPVAAPTELPPAVRRRPASAARVVPPPPASIGSPDAVVRAEPVPAPVVRARPAARASLPSAPSAGAMGSPDGPARPAASAPAAPSRVAPAVRATPPPASPPPVVAPPCSPPTDDEEECPGGVCRVPGM